MKEFDTIAGLALGASVESVEHYHSGAGVESVEHYSTSCCCIVDSVVLMQIPLLYKILGNTWHCGLVSSMLGIALETVWIKVADCCCFHGCCFDCGKVGYFCCTIVDCDFDCGECQSHVL